MRQFGRIASPSDYLAQFRSGFQSYLYGSDFYWVEPLDQDSKVKWVFDRTTVGAVLVFARPEYLPPEYKLGALVVGCYDSKKSTWIDYIAVEQVPPDNGACSAAVMWDSIRSLATVPLVCRQTLADR